MEMKQNPNSLPPSITDSTKKQELLSEFPNVKLSYENVVHKKVGEYDFAVAIPRGKRCFAWFSMYEDKPACYLMELSSRKEVESIRVYTSPTSISFHWKLSLGTILYGTIFKQNHFAMEDVLFYQGKSLQNTNTTWREKLDIFQKINKDIQPGGQILFGLPIMKERLDEILNDKTEHYPIFMIHFRKYSQVNYSFSLLYSKIEGQTISTSPIIQNNRQIPNPISNPNSNYNPNPKKTNTHQNKPNPERRERESVFKVKADIDPDIYHLYSMETGEFVEVACIPDYKTSVLMNKLFRNIKENENLDALEESDDDEEFENIQEDKFVDLEKEYKMKCGFHYRFRKWYPIQVVN
jgi:hypothetical protein